MRESLLRTNYFDYDQPHDSLPNNLMRDLIALDVNVRMNQRDLAELDGEIYLLRRHVRRQWFVISGLSFVVAYLSRRR